MNKFNPSIKPDSPLTHLMLKKDLPNPFPSFYHSDRVALLLAEDYAYEECGCKENPNQTNINWPYRNIDKLIKIKGKYEVVISVNLNIDPIGPIVIGPKSILNITSSNHPLYPEIKELYKQHKIKKL